MGLPPRAESQPRKAPQTNLRIKLSTKQTPTLSTNTDDRAEALAKADQLNDLPQPQLECTFGFLILNPDPCKLST
jgi:hypothetical protein